MSDIKVNSTIVWNGKKAEKAFDAAIVKALETSAILVQNAAVKNTIKQVYSTPESPSYKRSGDLKRSITRTKPSNGQIFVGSPLEYSPYVEYGTRYVKARPFLVPALLLNIKRITSMFKRIYKGVKYVD